MGAKGRGRSKTVTVRQAAVEMGISESNVRHRMQAGIIDIGDVIPSTTGKRCDYCIYRKKLDKWLEERGLL